ncbi:MAG: hypothetical protein ACKPKO_44580, partial [Candidatus Fonsibacter sp.]
HSGWYDWDSTILDETSVAASLLKPGTGLHKATLKSPATRQSNESFRNPLMSKPFGGDHTHVDWT